MYTKDGSLSLNTEGFTAIWSSTAAILYGFDALQYVEGTVCCNTIWYVLQWSL